REHRPSLGKAFQTLVTSWHDQGPVVGRPGHQAEFALAVIDRPQQRLLQGQTLRHAGMVQDLGVALQGKGRRHGSSSASEFRVEGIAGQPLDTLAEGIEEGRCRRPIDGAMVEGQRQSDHFSQAYAATFIRQRLPLSATDTEDRHLGQVEQRREVVHPRAPQVGDGKGRAGEHLDAEPAATRL
ncbi:hypothetical protein AN167_26590, partial [Vibrio splendidus]